jgi:DNA-binding winged helix-turn-helix (wHTH) protein
MEAPERYTASYRSNETQQVMDWVKAGQCGCIIGLRGAGKSNFLHFIFREDVRLHYLGQEKDNYLFIPLDLLSLSEYSSWSVYELILHRLADQLHFGVENGIAKEIAELRQELDRTHDTLSAQRALERIVDILCQQPERRLIFFFDEFDEAFRSLAPQLFRNLRSLRDAHKEQLSYIVIAAKDLSCLRSDLAEVEHFYRLVSRNLCGLGPYDDSDARQMIRHLARQRSRALGQADMMRLIELSGGHAGLLKSFLGLLWNTIYAGNLGKLELAINQEPGVQRECQKIWDGLSEDEQVSLCSLTNEEQVDPQIVQHLKFRRILRGGDTPVVFSPLFAAFIRAQAPPPSIGTYIIRSPRIVQLDGRRVETLTELEFEVLCYLYEQGGRLCTKNDLLENVYRQRYADMQGGVSDEALQALISRLREKIEPDRTHPRYVITIRGEGYRFVGPGN